MWECLSFQVLTGPPRTAGAERTVVVMDNRSEIRDFLTSRRARITPEQAGLPAYDSTRRVTGLRREEVALLAGVSVDYYTRLERGNARGASDTVLDALARALQLDEAERAHLFDLARATNAINAARASRRPAGPQVRPAVQRILDSMAATPAYLRNGRMDILAANQLGRASMRPSSTARPSRPITPGSSSSTRGPRNSSPTGTARPATRWLSESQADRSDFLDTWSGLRAQVSDPAVTQFGRVGPAGFRPPPMAAAPVRYRHGSAFRPRSPSGRAGSSRGRTRRGGSGRSKRMPPLPGT